MTPEQQTTYDKIMLAAQGMKAHELRRAANRVGRTGHSWAGASKGLIAEVFAENLSRSDVDALLREIEAERAHIAATARQKEKTAAEKAQAQQDGVLPGILSDMSSRMLAELARYLVLTCSGATRPRYAAGVGDAFTFIEDVEELEQVDMQVAAAQERLISAVQRRVQLRGKMRDALVASIRATSPEPLDVLRGFQQVLMQARQCDVGVREILMPPAEK